MLEDDSIMYPGLTSTATSGYVAIMPPAPPKSPTFTRLEAALVTAILAALAYVGAPFLGLSREVKLDTEKCAVVNLQDGRPALVCPIGGVARTQAPREPKPEKP